jgi:hypothetical protein
MVPPEELREKWKALKPRVKAANVPKWAQRSQESIWESGEEVGDGAGKQEMEGEMCTENDKEGRGWERQWQQRLQRCRIWPSMARHVQRIALVLWFSGQHWNRRCNAAELGRGEQASRSCHFDQHYGK